MPTLALKPQTNAGAAWKPFAFIGVPPIPTRILQLLKIIRSFAHGVMPFAPCLSSALSTMGPFRSVMMLHRDPLRRDYELTFVGRGCQALGHARGSHQGRLQSRSQGWHAAW